LQGFRENWSKPAGEVVRPSMRWKLVGNAVSVKAAAWIGRRLATPGHYDGTFDAVLPESSRWPRAAWSLGDGRYAADVSTFPVKTRRPALAEFLKYDGSPLSLRAASGFRRRTDIGNLRFPESFLEQVDAHIRRMRQRSGDAVDSREKTERRVSAPRV
jgi:DNA (cytosine-5)-methyltransferase 1